MDYDFFKIKEYKLWTLYLHENQSYLGRMYLLANRKNATDFIDINEEERKEFFFAAKEVKSTLTILFEPDLMNYASLGNRFRRLHVHFIPRYKKERRVGDFSFVDTRWGMNYAPYNREFVASKECLMKIKSLIKKTFKA